jgi:hypothetical protein
MAGETQTETPNAAPQTSNVQTSDNVAAAAKPNGAEDKTLVDGGGGPDTHQAPPPTWPEDWRQRFAGSDAEALKTLNRFKDPANIWKSYQGLRQRVDTGEFKRARPDPKDEKAYGEWKAEAGIPEKPEGYLEKLPENLRDVPEDHKDVVNRLLEIAHKSDMTPDETAKGLDIYWQVFQAQEDQRHEQDKQHRLQAEDELRAAWGPEFRATINGITTLLDTHAPKGLKERLFTARLSDGTPVGNDPQMLQFLASLDKEINPHGTVTPNQGQDAATSIADEIKQLEMEAADTKSRKYDYWQSPAKQARLRQLYEIEERMKRKAG